MCCTQAYCLGSPSLWWCWWTWCLVRSPFRGLCTDVFMEFHLKEEAKELRRVPFTLTLVSFTKALPRWPIYFSKYSCANVTTMRINIMFIVTYYSQGEKQMKERFKFKIASREKCSN